jgi:hypothetical protein
MNSATCAFSRFDFALHLASSPLGRTVLHFLCLARDGRWRWHWQGIRRELLPPSSDLQTSIFDLSSPFSELRSSISNLRAKTLARQLPSASRNSTSAEATERHYEHDLDY